MSQVDDPSEKGSGAIAWMAGNSVAANFLMLVCLLGGLFFSGRIKQEVFPEVDLDRIQITIAYPGASPEEVEQGIVLAIEEAVRGIDGVKEVKAFARENAASVSVDLLRSADPDAVFTDVQNAVDRVTSFPTEAERPVFQLLTNRQEVISLIIYGDADERSLKNLAEQVREQLLVDPYITQVEVSGLRPIEVSIEIPQEKLREYGLTLEAVGQAVTAASVDLPGGSLRTESGEILLRTSERRETGSEFADVTVLTRPDGTVVRVGDLGSVVDGFRETDEAAWFEGKRAVRLQVFRVGMETPIQVSDAVQNFIKENEAALPTGVKFSVWNDTSVTYRERIDLLMRNAQASLILVALSLALFMELRLAFWVTMGIPTSILGSMVLMPWFGASFNMITLFAFILTLGIVVDDAIVVGDSIYEKRQKGVPPLRAAYEGAREVAAPVVFSVLTTVAAFVPLLFLPGTTGKFFYSIPIIVISVLTISLLEGLFILPAHLAHSSAAETTGIMGFVNRAQAAFNQLFLRAVGSVYTPILKIAIWARYTTTAFAVVLLIIVVSYVRGGGVQFTFMPRVESDNVSIAVEMPFGTAVNETQKVERLIVAKTQAVLESRRVAEGRPVHKGLYSEVGRVTRSGGRGASSSSGSHLASVSIQLVSSEARTIKASELVKEIRAAVGEVPGVESIQYNFSTGFGGGTPVDVEISHSDRETLERAAKKLAELVMEVPGTFNVDDGFTPGKPQFDFELTDQARALGITEVSLARQLRSAFFGSEVARQQRGREELRVYVRRPLAERNSAATLDSMIIRAPSGVEIPLRDAAIIDEGFAYTAIERLDSRRVVHVTSDVDTNVNNAQVIIDKIRDEFLPELVATTPGLNFQFGGEQRAQRETFAALKYGMSFALIVMFALIAIPLRSYIQPVIVMLAIPFGFMGAIVGHILVGVNLSMLSIMGMVALAGVAVNDSLVLVDAVNENRARGLTTYDALVEGTYRRFRPILLTSLTTFLGLAPLIYEKSVQARFLVGMAVSLGWGVVFTTVVTLIVVPCIYLIVEDAKHVADRLSRAFKWLRGADTDDFDPRDADAEIETRASE